MFKVIENKSLVDVAVSQLLESLTDIELSDNIALDELNKKNDVLNKTNIKLLNEISTCKWWIRSGKKLRKHNY